MEWQFARSFSPGIVILALTAHGLLAQEAAASIRGVVTDRSGRPLRDAIVSISDLTKSSSRKIITSDRGDYEFVALAPADTFSLTVEAAGFRRKVRSGIVLEAWQQRQMNLQLVAGDVTGRVTAAGAASLMQPEDAAVEALVDERKVKDLPPDKPQLWQLSGLVPNVLQFGLKLLF